MIRHHIRDVHKIKCVALKAGTVYIARPAAKIAHHHIMRVLHHERPTLDADAVAWRRLSGDGEVAHGDLEIRCQINRPGNIEDDGAIGHAHALTQAASKRSGSIVICGRDVKHRPTAAAPSIRSRAFRAGERRQRRKPVGTSK